MIQAYKPEQAQRHLRAQTYAAEPAPGQVAEFDLYRAAVTWFYNQAIASQLDRWRHRAGIESNMSLTYAVRVARESGVDFPYHPNAAAQGERRLLSDVPAVMLHGTLRQLSASWTRHLKALAEWKKRPHPPGEKCPSNPPGFRSVFRGGSLYWQVQDGAGPCPVGKLITVTRKGTRDRPAMATLRPPGKIGPVIIRYHRELPADTMIRFASLRVDDLGRYWVTVQYDTAQVRQPAKSGVVGVDVGVAVTAATSDGEVYDAPGLTPGQQQRKDRLQRSMARKRRLNPCKHDRFVAVKGRKHPKLLRGHCPPPGHSEHECCSAGRVSAGDTATRQGPACEPASAGCDLKLSQRECCHCWKHSTRYLRNKAEFLKLSQRAARQRTAAAHLASRALADRYATVVVENLDVSAMTASAKGTEEEPGKNVKAKAGLNREILAGNWYQLRQFTAYKTQVVTVPAPYTSLQCPRCGTVDNGNRPERDLFRCVSCGLSGHADIIAAQNIRDRYMDPTAAAQAVAAREICQPEGEQPANSQPNSITTPDATPSASTPRVLLQPGGNLIPEAWGRPGARKRPARRRSRRLRKPNRHDGG